MYWFYYESRNLGISDCNLNYLYNFLKENNIPLNLITIELPDEFGMDDYSTPNEILDSILFYYQGC